MDKLQFFASLASSTAWPFATVVIGLIFRPQLNALLGKVRSLKGVGLEAEFAEDTKKIAEKVMAKLPAPVEIDGLDSAMGKRFAPASDERPSAVVLDSWWELEHAVGSMVDELDIETRYPSNIMNCLDALKDIIPTETRVFIDELRRLRNQVASNRDLEPDEGTAYRYFISAKNVVESLRQRTETLKAMQPSERD